MMSWYDDEPTATTCWWFRYGCRQPSTLTTSSAMTRINVALQWSMLDSGARNHAAGRRFRRARQGEVVGCASALLAGNAGKHCVHREAAVQTLDSLHGLRLAAHTALVPQAPTFEMLHHDVGPTCLLGLRPAVHTSPCQISCRSLEAGVEGQSCDMPVPVTFEPAPPAGSCLSKTIASSSIDKTILCEDRSPGS